ncbi:methionine--tRNA ligase [bacterium]|nr:methionine--tRNA ligase [bacterium]
MTRQTNPKKILITTPIYYINDRPHIGHAYSTIAADTLARYWRNKIGPENVRFSTGTDENSKKTIEAAREAGLDIPTYTDKLAAEWRQTWDSLKISYDDFIRTSEPRHKQAVDDLVNKIHAAGDVTKDIYEGPYCFRCEAFYRSEELVDDKCPIHKKEVENVKEDNYFFDLPKYADKLTELIRSGEFEIQPESRRNEVLAFIERGLEPISISRANQEIGLTLPFDESQRIYVWVEALINYLTVAGYPGAGYEDWWSNVTHIVGKDIIKFHCIIWPALLISAGVGLPKRVIASGFWTIDGEKISKSLGNSIDPVGLAEQYGNDALRYYLLSEIPFGADGNFSTERFKSVYASELANGLGNLVQRVASMLKNYNDRKYDHMKIDEHFDTSSIAEADFTNVCADLQKRLDTLNAQIEQNKPWELVKTDKDSAVQFLAPLVAQIVDLGQAIAPILPQTAEKVAQIFADGEVHTDIGILFPRIEE